MERRVIEACWTENPSERLFVCQIVEKLRGLPDRSVDTFNISFASQVSESHSFFMLVPPT